jgi:hypothetical protein
MTMIPFPWSGLLRGRVFTVSVRNLAVAIAVGLSLGCGRKPDTPSQALVLKQA